MADGLREDHHDEGSMAQSQDLSQQLTPGKRPPRQTEPSESSPAVRRAHQAVGRRLSADWPSAEQAEAAEALTSMSEVSSQSEATVLQGDAAAAGASRSGRRVTFADGPLKGCPRRHVTHDGHPNHEGETAARKRACFLGYCQEPLTKHSISLLEAELGPENAASVARLRRRFGLAPPVERQLPHVSPSNRKQRPERPAVLVPIFGRVVRSPRQANSNRVPPTRAVQKMPTTWQQSHRPGPDNSRTSSLEAVELVSKQ